MSQVSVLASATGGASEGFWANALPILPPPGELIFGFVTFAVLYVVVKKYVTPRIEDIYQQRTDAIEGGMAKAEHAQAQAQALLKQYQAKMANAQDDANEIREQARADAAALEAETRARATEEAQRIATSARLHIAAERERAAIQLRAEVGAQATQLAELIVAEAARDPRIQREVVDRFLDEIDVSGAGASVGNDSGATVAAGQAH